VGYAPTTDPAKRNKTTAVSRRPRIDWGTLLAVLGLLVSVGLPVGCSVISMGNQVACLATRTELRDREVEQLRKDIIRALDRLESKVDCLQEARP